MNSCNIYIPRLSFEVVLAPKEWNALAPINWIGYLFKILSPEIVYSLLSIGTAPFSDFEHETKVKTNIVIKNNFSSVKKTPWISERL
jgi:hypothetical protein